ncbi:hypothetical protein [Actinoplanes sp. NPDC051494]|uniref:SbtR family transcriptional regulator n=1 Tax=Actinoplanes sp. NPDC051494 TaxID=3363907 RepID=UPI0037B62275
MNHLRTHQGLARTLAPLVATRSDALADGGRVLDQAMAGLLAAGVEEGSIREDVGAGTMVLHGICAAARLELWHHPIAVTVRSTMPSA